MFLSLLFENQPSLRGRLRTAAAIPFGNEHETAQNTCLVFGQGRQNMPEIRALFFDFGKTLIDYQLELIFRSFARVSGMPPEDVHEIWAGRGPFIGLSDWSERGLMTPAEFRFRWKRGLLARIPAGEAYAYKRNSVIRLSDEAFDECWNEMFGPRDLLYEEYIKRLRDAGYYLAIISNINPLHHAFISERYKVLIDLFHDFTASCDPEVQARKPDSRIYSVAFAKAQKAAGIQPEQSVFIDDVEENAYAVRAFGAYGIHARTFSQIFADLKALGVRW